MTSSIVGLLNNVALLLVAGFLFDMLGEYSRGRKPSVRQIIIGVMLGIIGLGVMLTPWELTPGLIFDTRSVLLAISGLFFGTIPTLIAVVFTTLLRISIGGAGVWPGVAVIVTSGAIGLIWRHLRENELYDISIRELYTLGIVVHINMVLWMFALPWPLSLTVVSQVGLPVMIIHPIGTALLGWLLVSRLARVRTEKALLRSEHQLRVITDSLPAYVAMVDIKDLRYRFVNSRFVESFKLPREKIVGSHIKDIIGQENYDFAKPYIDIVRAGQPASYENNFVTAGTQRWVNVNYVPDMGENGNAEAIIVLSYDMTERRQMEEALRDNERFLRAIAENYPNSYLSVIEKDFSVGFTAGREFAKQGLDPKDFVGLSIEQVFGDQADLVKEYYRRTFAGKEQTFELFFNGQHQRFNTVPFFADDGSVSRILAVVENITEQVEAERQLRESENRYRMLFERASDAIFLVDTKTGFYLDANSAAERLTGRSVEELRKTTIFEVTPRDVNERLKRISEADDGTTVNMGEVLYLRTDGTKRLTLLSAVQISDGLIFGLAHDITEQKKSELAVHEVNERLRAQLVEIKELEIALREQAVRDPLTGLFNRRYMVETLERELSKTKRNENVLSLVILDLDNLKDVNELYGHVTGGDKALQALAAKIQSLCRVEDTFCRYAGDEFVIILSDTPLPVAHQRVLEWQKAIADIQVDGKFRISFSAGVAEFPSHGKDGEELIQSADKALYRAKELGRDQVAIYQNGTTGDE